MTDINLSHIDFKDMISCSHDIISFVESQILLALNAKFNKDFLVSNLNDTYYDFEGFYIEITLTLTPEQVGILKKNIYPANSISFRTVIDEICLRVAKKNNIKSFLSSFIETPESIVKNAYINTYILRFLI